MTKKTNKSRAARATKARRTTSTPSRSSKKNQPTAKMRILNALASQRALGIRDSDRATIQGLAAIPNVGSFNTTILNMKKDEGSVTYTPKTITMTEAGERQVGKDALLVPTSNDAMQDKLKEGMSNRSKQIFDIMTDGNWYTRQELADKTGLENNNSFGTYVSGLSKVSERANGKIRLKDIAFPCGRPCDKTDAA